MVKIGEAKRRQLSKKRQLNENRGVNLEIFDEMGEIYEFC